MMRGYAALIGLAGASAVVVWLLVLRSQNEALHVELDAAESRSVAYKEAAEKAVKQGAALEKSRADAAREKEKSMMSVRGASDECLDRPLPAGLLD